LHRGGVRERGKKKKKRTEVVGQDGIAHGDMASHSLVEAAVSENAEGGCEVLLAVEALFFEGVELGVRSYAELLAGRRHAQRTRLLVLGRVRVVDGE
jgi:hypothetical protein